MSKHLTRSACLEVFSESSWFTRAKDLKSNNNDSLDAYAIEPQRTLGSKLGTIKAEQIAVNEKIALRHKDQPLGEWRPRLL